MPCEEQSRSEREHAAHEVVAHTVEGIAVGSAQHLQQPAHGDEQNGEPRTATMEQKAINYVELQHQTEEPIGTGPYHMVGVGHHVVEHKQLPHDVHKPVMVCTGRYGIDHCERHETHNHHTKMFPIV